MEQIKGKRVLIIGISGFIGSNLASKLLESGAELFGLIRQGSDLWRIERIKENIKLHYGDITDFDSVKNIVDEVNPHIIYNLAASKNSPAMARNKLSYAFIAAINIAATQNLLEATAHIDYERFIQIGSAAEYGAMNHAIKETDRPEPHSYFGTTKLAGSLSAINFSKVKKKPVSVLRFFSVYGYDEPASRFIPKAIKNIIEGREIEVAPCGYKHDCVFIEDVVDGCIKAAVNDKAVGEIINIATGVESTNEQIVNILEELTGRSANIYVGEFDSHLYDSFRWVADISKANELLGWSPKHNLKEGLEKTLASLVSSEAVVAG